MIIRGNKEQLLELIRTAVNSQKAKETERKEKEEETKKAS